MTAGGDDDDSAQGRRVGKSEAAFRTISEVVDDLDVPQHVLRFWETKFPQVKPLKRGGGRRYYRPADVALLRRIRDLLYRDGFTIKGVQKILRENGAKAVAGAAETPVQPALDLESPPRGGQDGQPSHDVQPMSLRPTLPEMARAELKLLLVELTEIRAELDAALTGEVPLA